jgi:16S rRNA (cytosine967-C5)-methyltransferase
MTPGARLSAAMEVLADMGQGAAAEQALTRWARRSRFAGSKDRAAVRDHVFDVLRLRRLAAHYGQGEAPRAMILGMLRAQGIDPAPFFSAEGHAPAPLTEAERELPPPPGERAVAWNLPDWLVPHFEQSLGAAAGDTAQALAARAPVTLRVNLARVSRADARTTLTSQGVETEANPLAEGALTISTGQRALRNAPAYLEGLVELQDAASQAVVAALPPGGRVLDFCAGGGGKALAMAMDPARTVFAHDIDSGRMSDLPARTVRAGASIEVLDRNRVDTAAPFDTVLCDAPCSGSGAWRRAPEGKWLLTPARLEDLTRTQDAILDRGASLTGPRGTLAYATCSVLRIENEDRVAAFLDRHPGWRCAAEHRFAVNAHGDGFYTAQLTQA